ncbi:hypothetical protein [Rubellicoccus peritrichatus]|uniref:Uncharacterized protein n=1 Tax=Rubellicoccus peritrichatus TaxID=3080537 RepID=A0AAQ3QUG9_9BACT|nr:hypothetical protein [Puniceicoccus sp. CR14]WOO42376.1 hypothetical protein RZN69_04690 [Puniceicoccus sp. CR14]
MNKTLCFLLVCFAASFTFAEKPNIYGQRIGELMESRWQQPLRAIWEIEYKPIPGLLDTSAWHIKGTNMWVRFHPEIYKLEELDKTKDYEIDAAALDQNYGTIDFYVYGLKAIKEPE